MDDILLIHSNVIENGYLKLFFMSFDIETKIANILESRLNQ